MSLKCHYHPKRGASDKCESCEKIICLECKKSFNVVHSTDDSSYATRHIYCKPCYYKREIKGYQSSLYLVIPCFIIPILLIASIVPVVINVNLVMAPLIIVPICLGLGFITWYYAKIYAPEKEEELKKKLDNFYKGLE